MEDENKELTPQEQSTPTDNDVTPTERENKLSMYESSLRDLLGLKQDESLDNIQERITAYKDTLQTKNAQLNEKLISAELSCLQGYDTKLLARVIDRSNIKVSDDGVVTGLKEAVLEAEKEYPAVIKKQDTKPYAPYNPVGTSTSTRTMNDIIRNRRSI